LQRLGVIEDRRQLFGIERQFGFAQPQPGEFSHVAHFIDGQMHQTTPEFPNKKRRGVDIPRRWVSCDPVRYAVVERHGAGIFSPVPGHATSCGSLYGCPGCSGAIDGTTERLHR
jgi:hypothetical protein